MSATGTNGKSKIRSRFIGYENTYIRGTAGEVAEEVLPCGCEFLVAGSLPSAAAVMWFRITFTPV